MLAMQRTRNRPCLGANPRAEAHLLVSATCRSLCTPEANRPRWL